MTSEEICLHKFSSIGWSTTGKLIQESAMTSFVRISQRKGHK